MSTPSAVPITLTDVNTELQETLPITLAQSTVRTLCSIPSGAITLKDCLNRTFFTYQRANALTTTGSNHGTVTNPTYAYDTTATSVDSSTEASLSTSGTKTNLTDLEFAAATVTGTLSVNLTKAEVDYQMSSDTINEAASDITVEWSTNNGSTWSSTWDGSVEAVWSGFDTNGFADHAQVLTKSISSQAMADLIVRITAHSFTIGAGSSRAAAIFTWWLADVVVLP